MARVEPLQQSQLSPAVQVAVNRHLESYNSSITNATATLAHSLTAFEAYMHWYPLYEQIETLLGKRMAYLYAFAITKETKCAFGIAYFRKKIIDAGENPEMIPLSSLQEQLLAMGAGIAKHHGKIADHLYNAVAKHYTEQQMVVLSAFAGQMVACSVFNNVVETEPDQYLENYIHPLI